MIGDDCAQLKIFRLEEKSEIETEILRNKQGEEQGNIKTKKLAAHLLKSKILRKQRCHSKNKIIFGQTGIFF
jgi:hypothetical protein